jgi:aspartate carbamoyltransferase regulatory subunit
VLGYIDPGITVNIIKEGQLVEKKKLSLPEHLVNVIICKNPRCITTVEGALDQHFILKDRERGIYRCMFCDAERKSKALR